MQTNIASSPIAESTMSLDSMSDYGELLEYYGLKYKKVEYYFQVGEIDKTQGWILHLSVVLSQIGDLLQTAIPFLVNEKVPFKIVMNGSAGEDLLNGNFGLAQIGKIVSIYPDDNRAALSLAKKLITLTNSYKGPAIPTDICLGNIVYTRYGSFNPVLKSDANGIQAKYIYAKSGELIRDPYVMPFQLPQGVEWPFKELANPILPDPPKLFNRIYKILEILKPDPRGNVFKGLYVKSLLQVKNVVLKQGFSNSASDRNGRDIRDRLTWQAELYKELSAAVTLPIIYDLIQENTYTLLVMEYINGDSLYQKAHDLNPFSKSWSDLSAAESVTFIHYGAEITHIIGEMHKKGYLHRDINPVNFLLDKKNKIFLIDIELAYSIQQNKPDPPFQLGTPGFMSPEQEATQYPTIKQDIYGLGATLLFLFAGITPIKFNTKEVHHLAQSLNFFIDNAQLAGLFANCLHTDPQFRPDITDILKVLTEYQDKLQKGIISKPGARFQRPDNGRLKATIQAALKGLLKPPVISWDDLWYSKQVTIENFTSPRSKQYAIYPGLGEGMGGPLYLLARLHKAGINVDSCRARFIKGWEWIEQNYFTQLPELSPGLYKGAAGVALALAEGIHSGLLENNPSTKEKILRCLDINCERLDLAGGISGQGLSILQCSDLIDKEVSRNILSRIVNQLLSSQQKDGSWQDISRGKNVKNGQVFDFSTDSTAIIWFLLEYIVYYPNNNVQLAILRAMNGILKK